MEESWRRWSSQERARLSLKTLQYSVCMSTHFLLKPLTVVSYHIREVRIFSLSSHNSQKSLLLVECCSDCYEPCTQLSPEGHVCHFMGNNLWIVWAGWAATSLMVWFYFHTVHYSGFLEYSDQPFETTTHLKYPQMMKLGRGEKCSTMAEPWVFCFPAWNIPVLKVILQTDVTLAGLELGLLTMKKGEFSRFLLQPQYAYGEMGCPPFIPAAAVVLYEVQILDYLDSGQVDDFITMSLVGRLQVLCLVLPTSDRSASLLHILKSLYFFAFIAQIRNGLWFLFSSSGAAEHRSYVHTSWSCQHTAELWQPFLQPEPILQCQRSL